MGTTGSQATATTATTTAVQTINRAFRLIGVLADGETPTSPMYNDALLVWQHMYDSWSAVSSIPPVPAEFTHTMVVGQKDYTIGPTGDIVRARPTDVLNAVLRVSGSGEPVDYPLFPLSRDAYYGIGTKDLTVRPTGYLYEQTDDNSTIRFDAKPEQAYTLVCYVLDTFTAPTDIDDDVSLQPGYAEAIVYNLATRLMPEYGIAIQSRPEIPQRAATLLRDIKNRYAKIPEMPSLFAGQGRYDIYADRNRGRF
jgi:hypothetical protein